MTLFLLANHGALTIGSSVLNAYHKMETLEHAAMIQFVAKQLGKINTLNTKQTNQLIDLRAKFGIRKEIGTETNRKIKTKIKLRE